MILFDRRIDVSGITWISSMYIGHSNTDNYNQINDPENEIRKMILYC